MTDQYGYRGWLGGVECDVSEEVQLPAVRSGVDEFAAIYWAVIFAVGASVSLGMAIYQASLMWLVVASISWLAGVVAATCTRWRVRIDMDGVEYRRWECGIPVERKVFLLDVDVSFYESWEADSPEGIEIRDPRGGWDDSTGCFGPYFSQRAQVELIEWVAAAVQKARAAVDVRVDGVRCAELDGHMNVVRPTKWGRHGEVREADTTADLTLSGVLVPEGSTLLFNDDRPIRDPRREDTLSGVRISKKVVLPNGFELRGGARVSFVGDDLWVHENGPGEVNIEGVSLYRDDVMFDAEGHPTRYTLAEPTVVDGVEIPAESDVSRMSGFDRGSYWFYVWLAKPEVHDPFRYWAEKPLGFESVKRFGRPHSPHLCDARQMTRD